MLLEQGEEEIEEGEREMIRRVVEIGDTAVREAMVPRPDIVAVDVALTARRPRRWRSTHGYSRVPVWEGGIDNIVGVLYAKDALATLLAGHETPVRELMRPPLLVPESKLLDELLAEFKALRVHMAIVLDEYGGTAGIVTIEDLIEEIVGRSRTSTTASRWRRCTASRTRRRARRPRPPRLADRPLRLPLRRGRPGHGRRLRLRRLGKIPASGDEVRVEGLVLTVVRLDGRRIARVRATRPMPRRPETKRWRRIDRLRGSGRAARALDRARRGLATVTVGNATSDPAGLTGARRSGRA